MKGFLMRLKSSMCVKKGLCEILIGLIVSYIGRFMDLFPLGVIIKELFLYFIKSLVQSYFIEKYSP